MAKTLQEYAEWLDERDDLIWPLPPEPAAPKATPYLKPLEGIRLVLWDVYGTLLHIADGELLHVHPQEIRMQIALEKTIEEFNMWNSMTRKPGAPWEYMLQLYKHAVENLSMAATKRAGDAPHIGSARVWKQILNKLLQREYRYDVGVFGDLDQYTEKIAYFFHASLQGCAAMPHVNAALQALSDGGVRQGLLADAQPFTLVQILRATRRQGTLPPLAKLFSAETSTLSCLEGIRKPSPSFFKTALEKAERLGIAAQQILYIGARLRDDLQIAKQLGLQTALFAGEETSLRASPADMKDPNVKPHRLLTDLQQIRQLLSIG